MFRDATESNRHKAIRKVALHGSIVFSLLLGTLVYLLDRNWSTVLFLVPVSDWQSGIHGIFGDLGQTLPSFFHACAFSLLLVITLGRMPHARVIGVTGWFIVATALEVAQTDTFRDALFGSSVQPASATLINIFQIYVVNGHFDPGDLVATAFGCAAAYAIASVLEEHP